MQFSPPSLLPVSLSAERCAGASPHDGKHRFGLAVLLLCVLIGNSEEGFSEIEAGSTAPASLMQRYWVPRSAMAPAAARRLPAYCEGSYRRPEPRVAASVDIESLPVEALADAVSYEVDQFTTLTGNVKIIQGNKTLTAAEARLNNLTRAGELRGDVLIEQPNLVLNGTTAQINLNTRVAKLQDVEYLMLANEYRGEASAIKQDESGNLLIENSRFTRCEPGVDFWRVDASQIDIEKDAVFGIARNAVVRVKDIPIFYTPFLRFPVKDDRLSGWLFPTFGYSSEDGTEFSIPYYWNIAPNYDATLVPRLVGDRGVGAEAEFRYLSGWQESSLAGGYLLEDDLYDGTYQKEDFAELFPGQAFNPEDRWLYAINHRGRVGRLSSIIDYTAVSDQDYFRDLGSDLGVSSQIELQRFGELHYEVGDLSLRLWAQRFQRLDGVTLQPYQRLPELDLSYASEVWGGLEYSISAQLASFDRDTKGVRGISGVTGDRVHVEPRLRLPLNWSFGYLNFEAGYRFTQYDLDAETSLGLPSTYEESPERSIALGSVGGGLFFERDFELASNALVQTLEPQFYYLYQEFEDQSGLPRFDANLLTFSYSQLFRDNRFSGVDRVGDANQLAVGLTSRVLDPRSGREFLRASVGAIQYFEDRQVALGVQPTAADRQSSSAIAAELSGALGPRWRLSGSFIWDANDNEVDEGALNLMYRRDNGRIFNIGYRNLAASSIEQTDFSFYWPLSRHISMMARWNYDLRSGRTIEGFGGLEYNNCCWRMRVLARRFIDSPSASAISRVEPDEGIFVQIVFKGLAGLGTRVESVLERGIRGYYSDPSWLD